MEKFYKLKNLDSNKILDKDIINDILSEFNKSTYKKIYINKKKNNNLLKNYKLQNQKNSNDNKILNILNKLAANNHTKLIKEIINNINLKQNYKLFLSCFYNKIIKEPQFINNYLSFFILISSVMKKKFDMTPKYFIELIENDINNIFFNNKDVDEYYRKNLLILIDNLINKNILQFNLETLMNSIILNSNNNIDIYNWFVNKNIKESDKNKIKNIYNNTKNLRESTLLSELINEKEQESYEDEEDYNEDKTIVDYLENDKIMEMDTIIDEYLFIHEFIEILEYIKTDCNSQEDKTNLCSIIIHKFIMTSNDELILLIDKLIKKQKINQLNIKDSINKLLNNKEIINNFYIDKKDNINKIKSIWINKSVITI